MQQLKKMDDFISEKIESVEKLKAEQEKNSEYYLILVSREIAYRECLNKLRENL